MNFEKIAYIKGPAAPSCILCAIRDRAEWVVNLSFAESAFFIACVNLYPFNAGHLLVFPKRHVEHVAELSDDEALDLHRSTLVLLDVLKTTHQPAAFNIGYNMGRAAGASIDHLHQHIIPRYPREIGMADLIAGKRVLIEAPEVSADRLRAATERDGRLAPFRP